MSWLWGKKKKEEKPATVQDAGQSISEQIDVLDRKIEQCTKQSEQALQNAIKAKKAKQQKKALEWMKRKKLYDTQIAKFESWRYNLEQSQFQLQSAKITASVFNAQKTAVSGIKSQMAGIDADKVEEFREQQEELQDNMREVEDLLGAPMGEPVDEDELNAELEAEMELGEGEDIAEDEPTPARGSRAKPQAEDDEEAVNALMAGF